MDNISIFGTNSDVGKSTITFIIAKILQNKGLKIAPFKAQNVSNNAKICDDKSEISISQYFQAEILQIPTSYHLNPILLKINNNFKSSLIVNGKYQKTLKTKEYYKDIKRLKPIVKKAYDYLDARYDCVICEGAGSPVELNLIDKDLSNIFIAKTFKTKIILVADISKGGVFASIYGVKKLLPKKLRKNIIGVIINKFQGDIKLFDKGIEIIEKRFKLPILGVLPYMPLNLGFEDSASLKNFTQNKKNIKQKIAIIAYPKMSNFNDFEPLVIDKNIYIEFIHFNTDLSTFDLIILPGSKMVIDDLRWLKKNKLFKQIKKLAKQNKQILGICGGYEMMFKNILDNKMVENKKPTTIKGFEFIDDDIIFYKKKILKKQFYDIFDKTCYGFELHHGISKKYPLYYEKDNISGTFVHGLFDDDRFIKNKKKIIDNFINQMKKKIDLDTILKGINYDS